MTLYAFFAVGVGAALGAWLRWGFGLWFNPALPELPLGTLAANLVGGYLIGLAMAFFIHYPSLSPEWRLFIITGFLGGLTTFSTFSAETVTLLLRFCGDLVPSPPATGLPTRAPGHLAVQGLATNQL